MNELKTLECTSGDSETLYNSENCENVKRMQQTNLYRDMGISLAKRKQQTDAN